MYFQRSQIAALQKPNVKPRTPRVSTPRALDSVTGVNAVVGTVAVALAVDTLAVFWKKYRKEQALKKNEQATPEDD